MAPARLRHLPPTAVPISVKDVWRGLTALLDPAASLERFRGAIATLTGSESCFLVSSGRAALTVTLLALKRLADRTHVVIPAYSCPTVVQSILAACLEPVFCDVSPQTLDFDDAALARVMSRRPLAVVPTHLYGLAHRVDHCVDLGRRYGVFVVEDAAQSFGARIDGQMVGTFGDAGFYSLGRGKCLPVGHGGVIVAGPRLASAIVETIRERFPGRPRRGGAGLAMLLGYGLATRPAGWWVVARSPINPETEGMDETRLPSVELGVLSSDQAGVGLSILDRLDRLQASQGRNARRLMAELERFDFVTSPKIPPEASPVFLRLPVVVERRELADRLFRQLWEMGISRSYYRTLPDLYASRVASNRGDFPGASVLAERLLTLPTHPYVTDADVERIAEAFRVVGAS